MVKGRAVTTIEGLRGEDGALHGGLQCGYCTPGFIMAALALLERHPRPTPEEVRAGLAGNLCRCTGYMSIVESILGAADALAAAGPSRRAP